MSVDIVELGRACDSADNSWSDEGPKVDVDLVRPCVNEIAQLRAERDNLASQVKNLTGALDWMNNALANAPTQSEMDALRAKIDGLQAAMPAYTGPIDALEENINLREKLAANEAKYHNATCETCGSGYCS